MKFQDLENGDAFSCLDKNSHSVFRGIKVSDTEYYDVKFNCVKSMNDICVSILKIGRIGINNPPSTFYTF